MVLSIITQNLHYSIITYTRTSFGKPSRQNIKLPVKSFEGGIVSC